jgi:TetR/AcrR family transcriptional regulator, repressor for uid operon
LVTTKPTTQEVILAAAQCTIRQRGAAKLTMSAVAAEAGVSRPTLYRWFPTKVLLLGAIASHAVEQFDLGLQMLAEQHTDPTRRLEAALRYLVGYVDDQSGAGAIHADAEFALQSLADSLAPHVESFARVLGDALDEVPAVRAGTATRQQAAELFLRAAYSQYLVPNPDPERVIAIIRAVTGLSQGRGTQRLSAGF